jgi:hypothetical protein
MRLALLSVMLLSSCAVYSEKVNHRRHTRALEIASELRRGAKPSAENSNGQVWREVENGIRVKTRGSVEVSYHLWPAGPFHVYSVSEDVWRYEE